MSEYIGCNKCKHDNKREEEPCNKCIHGTHLTDNYEPKTNADRIRNMTDEELAINNIYFVSNEAIVVGLHYTGLDGKYYRTGKEVYEANLKWLQAEVGDVNE